MSVAFSIPAASIYLGTYGRFRDVLLKENDGIASKGAAGAIAGVCSSSILWTVMTPVDVIRTRVQVFQPGKSAEQLQGANRTLPVLKAIREVYALNGTRGFYAGLLPMYFRAVLISAPCMWSYETARDVISRYRNAS